ncbi:spermatogenesis associated 6-like protein [Xenentodon cancila]
MSRKALKAVVEIKFVAVSCPGVHLPAKDDIHLNICFMDHFHQSESLAAVFPLLFHEKMTFEKIFSHAVDPGEIAVMLEYETIRIELVQLVPPAGDILACCEENARSFLFPEPKLVPPFSGVDRELLMMRAPHFPGIAPRLEFSTKTTITECSPDAEVNVYPNTLMVGETFEEDPLFLGAHGPFGRHHGPDASPLRQSYREHAGHSRSESSSHREWEEVHRRVRGLLTTPKAVRRLIYGASVSEIHERSARRSSSGLPA